MLPPIVSLLLLAFAVSLDGFGVGVMYGLRKIRIPLLSIAIIAMCSGLIIFGSMQIGAVLLRFISPVIARDIGALILIGMGIWSLLQMYFQKSDEPSAAASSEETPPAQKEDLSKQTVLYIELKRMGIIIQILRKPSAADLDRSGNISASEAMLLGIALSLDAFGAGIGAALIGYNPMLTASLIALASGAFIYLGLRVGFIFAGRPWIRRISFLPGCILMIMGLVKMM
ncbi:sporulation membrane protein YtaF [Paenibacillus gansuensis]|uniref:Sporulation membrane protein YtaF n=1 Tax=Paenibacillus gansuensis TaxID=306542 RepID=A0ABW5PFI0_9BACL